MNTARTWRGLLLAALAAAMFAAGALDVSFNAASIRQYVIASGAAGPFVFVLGYAVATVLFLPGGLLTLAAGALFGPVAGALYSLTGATVGATLAFLIARFLVGERAASMAGGRVAECIRGVEAEGWRFVAFVRLVPLFPFNLVNYAFGLTRIPLLHYVLASYLCMLPGALAYAYLGSAGFEAATGGQDLIRTSLIALALIAATAYLPRLIAKVRRALGGRIDAATLMQRTADGHTALILDVRSPEEFQGELAHIPGALNIPLADLPAALPRLEPYRNGGIVVVCRTDQRSAKAAALLADTGFHDVKVLDGGMTLWNQSGLPVERQPFLQGSFPP